MDITFQLQQPTSADGMRSMQGFNPLRGECAAILLDERDGKEYRVRRMADGCWWMVDDLCYGRPSEITEWKEGCKKSVINVLGEGLYGVCRESPITDGGYLYNWQAVMQHADAAHGMHSSPSQPGQLWQGICPQGWHLPSVEELIRLKSVLGSCFRIPDTMDDNLPDPLDWNGIHNGFCDQNGMCNNYGMFGYYWSSSLNTSLDAYCLIFGNSLANAQGINGKFMGLGVRAVLDKGCGGG